MNDNVSRPDAVVGFVIDSDERVGGGGFLEIRRVRMRNRRADGSISEQYCCDSIARPYGQDAVIVAVFARVGDRVDILLRQQLRPAIFKGRDPDRAPLPEAAPSMFLTEIVAGILESHDVGEAGLRARAAAETLEEAGFVVTPDAVILLGAGALASPGAVVEKFYFTAVEVDPATQQPLGGDGSPMEEGASTRWMEINAVISACVAGTLYDLKTEAGLRRLRDYLA